MTAPRVRMTCCAALALAALTAGCGNFYEHVGESDWRAVGSQVPPASPNRGEFTATTLRAGSGRVVSAGDLVYVRLLVTTPRINPPGIPPKPWPVSAWLWTGAEPEPPGDFTATLRFGGLGSGRVRAALVGHAVGERFAIRLPADADRGTDEIPLYGLSVPFETGTEDGPGRWPTVKLASEGYGLSSADVEIVDACSARLLRREATLRQWGYVLNLFEQSYGPVRQGTLGWTAIESECGALGRNVRFEIGPLYYRPGGPPGGTQLDDWNSSYKTARAFQWGFVDVRYGVALLMAWVGFKMGRAGGRKAPKTS